MDVLNIVLPTFVIVILGYLAKRFGYLGQEVGAALTQYFLKIAVPAILFASIVKEPIGQLLQLWPFFLELTVVVTVMFFLGLLLAKAARMNLAESSVFAMMVSFANSGMLALPILYQIFGSHGMAYAVIGLLVAAIINVPLGMAFVEFHKASQQQGHQVTVPMIFLRAVVSTLKMPYVWSALLGLLMSALSIQLPHIVMTVLTYFAASTLPTALFAVGMDIDLSVFKSQLKIISIVSIMKLIVMPGLALLLVYVLNLPGAVAMALLISTAVPTAKSVFALSKAHEVMAREASAAVVGTTVFAIITVTLFTYLGHALWPEAFHRISAAMV